MSQHTTLDEDIRGATRDSGNPFVGGVAGLVGLAASNIYLEPADAMVAAAIVGLVAVSATWILSGGPEVTPAGVLSIAIGLFGYFPALYYSWMGGSHPMLPTATMYLLAVHMATMVLMTFAPSWPATPMWSGRGINRPEARWVLTYGIVLLAGGAMMTILLDLPSTALPAAVGFLGATLVAYSTTFTAGSLRKRSLVVAVGAVATYMYLLFETNGRLVIAGLAFTILLFLSQRARRRWMKALVLVSLAPALLLAARQRSDAVQASRGIEESGLESVVWPMDRLSILLALAKDGGLPPSWGDTFIPSVFFWVPRRLWPDKPAGFGSELVPVVRPGYTGADGHSEAATALGEWVWNFGIVGLVILPLVTALSLAILTKWRRSFVASTPSPRAIISHLAFALITAGMLDLFWVGTFGFSSRAGIRLIALAIFLFLSSIVPGLRYSQRESSTSEPTANQVVRDVDKPLTSPPRAR